VLLIANPGTACEDSAVYNLQYDSTSHLMKTSFSPLDSFDCEPTLLNLTNTSNHKLKQQWYINDTLVSTDIDFDTVLFKGRYIIKLVSEDSSTCNKKDSMIFPFKVLAEGFPEFSFVQDPCSLNVQFTDSTLLFPDDTVRYYWDFGNGKTSTEKNPFAEFDTSGTYKVKLTLNKGLDCEHSIEKNVTVNILPGVLKAFFTPEPDHSCTPAIITFNNQSTNDQSREWYYNNVLYKTTGTYTDTFFTDTVIQVKLIVYNPSTCQPADTIVKTVTVENATLSIFTALRDTCSNLVFFTNQSGSDNGEPLTYTWYFGDGDSSTLISPTHAYLVDSIYSVRLITNSGTFCADTNEVLVNYNGTSHILKVDFALEDSTLCNPAIFNATNLSVNGETFQWYLDDVITSSDSIYSDTLTNPGTYKLKLVVIDPATCKKTDSLIKTLVVARFGEGNFEIARDSCSLIVQFKNLSGSISGAPNTYIWYFGDGDSSTEVNPLHVYKETNIYTITQLTNPGSACADTTIKTYLIDGDTTNEIFIPNVFTPNDDGINDCYRIRGVSPKCDEYKVQIYNRWGEIYFETTDPSQCWNGKNEVGTKASVGVYFYLMSIKKRDQERMEKHGTITLIR
jgi:gliding motility-associated-like protein